VARQHSTGRRRVRSNGRLGAVGITSRGEPEAGAEGEREAEAVPLTITPPLDEHRLDAEESEIGRKGIEPKARARMRSRVFGVELRYLLWGVVEIL